MENKTDDQAEIKAEVKSDTPVVASKPVAPAPRPASQTSASKPAPSAIDDDYAKTLGVIGFICAFFCQIAGIILSAISLKKYKEQKDQDGKGLAIAGLILSILITVGYVFVCVFYILFMFFVYSAAV